MVRRSVVRPSETRETNSRRCETNTGPEDREDKRKRRVSSREREKRKPADDLSVRSREAGEARVRFGAVFSAAETQEEGKRTTRIGDRRVLRVESQANEKGSNEVNGVKVRALGQCNSGW